MSLPSQIFQFLNQVLNVYYYMIIVRIFLTWFVNSYALERNPLGYWLCLLVDPFLRFFRRLPFTVIGGMIDISPIFALLSIHVVRNFLQRLSATQSAPVHVVFLTMLLQLLISIVVTVQTIILVLALILLFRLLHLLFSSKRSYSVAISHIDFYIRKLVQGPFSFLNLSSKKFVSQVFVVFACSCLLAYLLHLAQNYLQAFSLILPSLL